MEVCELCDEDIAPGERGDVAPLVAHRECLLRSVVGGIGHLTNHDYWCGQRHDPDGGYTYRQSAALVALWVRENGIEAVGR